jgi:hypothetical protein
VKKAAPIDPAHASSTVAHAQSPEIGDKRKRTSDASDRPASDRPAGKRAAGPSNNDDDEALGAAGESSPTNMSSMPPPPPPQPRLPTPSPPPPAQPPRQPPSSSGVEDIGKSRLSFMLLRFKKLIPNCCLDTDVDMNVPSNQRAMFYGQLTPLTSTQDSESISRTSSQHSKF